MKNDVLAGQISFDTLAAAPALPDSILDQPWDFEDTPYYINTRPTESGDPDGMYEKMLSGLVWRKWDELFMGGPYPELARIDLMTQAGLSGESGFPPYQGMLVTLAKNAWNAPFIKPRRLSESLEKNRVWLKQLDGRTFAISPFYYWGLADFWEENLYDRD